MVNLYYKCFEKVYLWNSASAFVKQTMFISEWAYTFVKNFAWVYYLWDFLISRTEENVGIYAIYQRTWKQPFFLCFVLESGALYVMCQWSGDLWPYQLGIEVSQGSSLNQPTRAEPYVHVMWRDSIHSGPTQHENKLMHF